MSDDTIEQLRRAVAGGDLGQRRPLLQALLRAQQPLDQAFPGEAVAVRIEERLLSEPVLEVLGALDPSRLRATGSTGRATLVDLGREEIRIACEEDGLTVTSETWDEYDRGMARWDREPWRWRYDAPRHVVQVAAASDGSWALVERLGGELAGGTPEALVADAPAWVRRCAPTVTLGVVGDQVVVVTADALALHDRATGAPSGPPRALPFEAKVGAVAPRERRVAVSDGVGLAVLDLAGRVSWHHDEARRTSARRARRDVSRIRALAVGTGRVAVCASDVFLWDLESGDTRGRAARGSETVYWEDPESTMGLGRDSGTYERSRAELTRAAFWGNTLLTVDAEGSVATWRLRPRRGAERGERLAKAEPRLLVATPDRLAAFPDGKALRLIGRVEATVRLDARPRALAPCGRGVLVGCTDGSVRWAVQGAEG